MNVTPILMAGSGGQAKVLLDALTAGDSPLQVTCITDADSSRHGQSLYGVAIVGGEERWPEIYASGVRTAIVAVGDNQQRAECAARLAQQGFTFVNVIHLQAMVSSKAKLGAGIAVMAGAVVQTESLIGNHCIINTGATVDHDCQISDFVHIAPGCHLGGAVTVGQGTLLGVGSSVIPGVEIGEWSVIGAGSVVVNDIPAGKLAYGNPAKPVKDVMPRGW